MTRELEFSLPLIHGLHARPASVIQGVTSAFAADISLHNRRNGRQANAKSVLSLVGADVRHNDPCLLTVQGPDVDQAFPAMRSFIADVLPGCDEELPAPETMEGGTLPPRVLINESATYLAGVPVSPGTVQAPVRILNSLQLPEEASRAGEPAEEEARFRSALSAVGAELEQQHLRATNITERDILQAHLGIVRDPEFASFVMDRITGAGLSAGAAVMQAESHYSGILLASESAYMRERAMDVRDVAARLLGAMYGEPPAVTLDAPCVVVAESLAPSQLLALDRGLARAIVTAQGGETSHTAILARAFGIPLITGIENVHGRLREGQTVVVDARRGLVIPDPSERVARYYALETRREDIRRARLSESASREAVTKDGRRVEVAANVSTPEEAEAAFASGAEGIGLFRTEMLFMDRAEPPTEDEQFEAYSRAVRAADGRPVIIRTLDIGGDKPLPYLNLPVEENPFLGYRAIRFYREHEDLVRAQMRAVLRAAALGNVRLMFPMVCSVEEVRDLKAILDGVREGLAADSVPFGSVEVGVMIEVPAAALAVDLLSEHVQFFSIGTNDLAQYTLAVDRGNNKVASLYSVLHPAFLRLLRTVVDTAHASGRWVGLCGEMGGQEALAPLLVGLGLDEVSAAGPVIPAMKAAIRRMDGEGCRALVDEACRQPDRAGVEALLDAFAASGTSLPILGADTISLESDAASREEVIKELVDRLYLAGRVSNPDTVEEAVWLREDVYSTGVGYGFAIPHCKSADVMSNSVGILRLRNPVEWKTLDDEPVRMAVMLAIREADQDDAHLRLFARLARKIMHEDFRERLLTEEKVEPLLDFLAEALEEPKAGQ